MIKTHNQKSYLERLTFDPKLLVGWIAGYITNIRIVFLLTLSIALLGVISYLNLPQRLNPEIKIPIVTVVTVLPGANPDDVEKLVTIPLEDKVRGLSGLDTVSSFSQENISIITLQFINSVPQEKAKLDVKDAVDGVTNLPEDANSPQIQVLDFENQPVWQFAVTTHEDPVSLVAFGKRLRDAIKELPNVDQVAVRGIEEEVIGVDILPEKLAQYGLNPLLLSQALTSGLGAYPAGTVETTSYVFNLTVDPSITTIEDIRNIRISVQNQTIHVGDIAAVSQRAKGNQPVSYVATGTQSGREAITFSVYKRSNADIVKTADSVHALVESLVKEKHDQFQVTTITNTGEQIQDQFTDLLGEFRSTILLVFACLFIFLGFRQAVISAFTVPLTFLSAFFIMRMVGMSINFLSLFAFLLSLGLLVDDTIVVVSAMTSYFRTRKFTPAQTGLLVWRDTIVPIWSTTITTIWSFVPLLLSSGIIGEFIKPIPVVVTVTMISSTAIAVLITLPIMVILLKPSVPTRIKKFGKIMGILALVAIVIVLFKDNPLILPILVVCSLLYFVLSQTRSTWKNMRTTLRDAYPWITTWKTKLAGYSDKGVINIEGFAAAYERFITRILESTSARRKVLIAILAYAVFSFALVPLGLVKTEFFPKSDNSVVYINLELPSGTTLAENKQETQALLESFRITKDTDFVVADIGTSLSGGFGGNSDQTNTTQFTFHLPAKDERHRTSIEIAEQLRKDTVSYKNGKISVIEESGGPPAGSDIQLKLSGDELSELNTYADRIVARLTKEPGVVNIEKSIKPGTSALVFVPNPDELDRYGINEQTLGLWLRTAVSGFSVGEVNFDKQTTDKTSVLFSFGQDRLSPEMLSTIMVPTNTGSTVPLLALGTLETRANPTLITREEGKRTISVSAGVSQGYSAATINTSLLKYADTISLPTGYEWKTGGANEENEKSVQSILQAMVVASVLILITMVIQFQSFRQALLVLLVIPLAVSSVFFVFALTGTPLSFPALIGILSLFGIVVTNSMFITDKINLNRKQGMPYVKAIADAGSSRMEPIILTKLCTVLGLLPITIADPLWRGLGGAIISGLLLASSIMLLFIPVVYYSWMKPATK
jgi:HAE1 family hydrophobic/amphiphilic exporter-1